MATAALVERLEAVAARLERAARKMGAGGGEDDEDEVPQFVLDFEQIVKTEVPAMAAAAEAINLKKLREPLTQAYDNVLALIKASVHCQKPEQPEMLKFLDTAGVAIQTADKLKASRKYGNHYAALCESLELISWVMSPTPVKHAEDQRDAADFNMVKVLRNAKDTERDALRAFSKAMKGLNNKVVAYVKEYFKMGLDWNPKGGALEDFDPAAAGAPAGGGAAPAEDEKAQAKEEEKPAKKKKAAAGGGDRAALFGDLNKGLKATAGLKPVTAAQKTKNRKDRSGKVAAGPKKAGKKREKKHPPVNEKDGPRWMVSNQDGNQDGPKMVKVEKADMKTSVYINLCDDTTVDVLVKVKSITVDNCIKCVVLVNEVVSTIELVNCKSVTLVCRTAIKSISVEKSDSPKIVLHKPAFDAAPDVYTSNVSAMNIEIPGETEGADNVDVPVPEQFVTKIDPKTRQVSTTEVTHG